MVASTTALAKINLTLEVLGRRADGFHEIRSLVAGVDLADELRCETRPHPGITLACSTEALAGPDNLAWRAADRLAREVGPGTGLAFHLTKRIPVAAGLGGGSSDAAAALKLANHVWRAGLPMQRLAALGAELGSDIPLFFALPSAKITGRGERVSPMPLAWRGWALLVVVSTEVPTPDVFKKWQQEDSLGAGRGHGEAIAKTTTADAIMALTVNDLEPAIFRVASPVQHVFETLHQAGFGPFRVSGAGAVLYKLFDDKRTAELTAKRIEELGLTISTAVVAAPVGGGPPDGLKECC